MRTLNDFMVVESPLIHPMSGKLEGPIFSGKLYDFRDRPYYRLTEFTGLGNRTQRLSHFLGMEIVESSDHAIARPMNDEERKDMALIISFDI